MFVELSGEIDNDIYARALEKFSNHLWYFNAELVAHVFFDPSISDEKNLELRLRPRQKIQKL